MVDTVTFLAAIFAISPVIIFFIFYFLYGREEKIDEIESLPPYIRDISEIDENLTPSECAVLANPITKLRTLNGKRVSEIVAAEIMELERLGYLEIIEDTDGNSGNKKSYYIKVNESNDLNKLTSVQFTIYSFIRNNSENGIFRFKGFEGRIDGNYRKKLSQFFRDVVDELHSILLSKKYIDEKGQKIVLGYYMFYALLPIVIPHVFPLYFLGMMAISSFLYYILSLFGITFAESGSLTIIISIFILLIIIGLFLIILTRPDVLSRWTKEGRLKHEKVLRFKKFIEDLTALEEKDIKDKILWERYLIYATALGLSKKIINKLDSKFENIYGFGSRTVKGVFIEDAFISIFDAFT